MSRTRFRNAAPASRESFAILYDADCAFCVREARRLVRLTGKAVRIKPLQAHYPPRRIPDEVKLHRHDGKTYGGAEAIIRALGLRKRWWPVTRLYYLPGVRQLADSTYRWVSAHRHRFNPADACHKGTCEPITE